MKCHNFIVYNSTAAPQKVAVTTTYPASLTVSWQLPEESYHSEPITGHVIQYTRVGSNDEVTKNVDRETTHTVILGLVANTEYSVRVATKSDDETGPFSEPKVQVSGEDSEFNKIFVK